MLQGYRARRSGKAQNDVAELPASFCSQAQPPAWEGTRLPPRSEGRLPRAVQGQQAAWEWGWGERVLPCASASDCAGSSRGLCHAQFGSGGCQELRGLPDGCRGAQEQLEGTELCCLCCSIPLVQTLSWPENRVRSL